MSSAAGTPKWPGDHAEKHRQAALLGWARKRGFTRDTVKRGRRKANGGDGGYEQWLAERQKLIRDLPKRDEGGMVALMSHGEAHPGYMRRYMRDQGRDTATPKAQTPDRDRAYREFEARFDQPGQEWTDRMRLAETHPREFRRWKREHAHELASMPDRHGRIAEPPSRGMELARQVQVSAQRTRPAAHPDYSPHAGNVARLTLMHELGMEQDAAKRAKIRRELRKLGVPSDQIPKEPRKPREPREPRKPGARISVRAHVYHGQPGFLVSGKDSLGRGVSIFARSKAEAERIREEVKAGREVSFDKPPEESAAERQRRIYLQTHPQSENDRILGEYGREVMRGLTAQRRSRVPSERSIENQRAKIASMERELHSVESEARDYATTSHGNFARQQHLESLIHRSADLQSQIDRRKQKLSRDERKARDLRKRAEGGAS